MDVVVEMVEHHVWVVDQLVRHAAELTEEQLDETFVDAFHPEAPMVMTYGAMVAHVLTFAAHHRLLAVARLRELGVTDLGWGDPKPWFTESVRRQVGERDQARDGDPGDPAARGRPGRVRRDGAGHGGGGDRAAPGRGPDRDRV